MSYGDLAYSIRWENLITLKEKLIKKKIIEYYVFWMYFFTLGSLFFNPTDRCHCRLLVDSS